MRKLRSAIREHLHFIAVATLLTLVMTFPTVLYLFRTDVMWLPIGSGNDANHWDIWYWERLLRGLEARSYTNVIFYPEGVSLVHHPFLQQPAMLLRIFLQQFMPLTNAFNIVFLMVIFSNALAAYLYALWLFKDKWAALVAAVVFGFSPHATNNPDQLHDATMASIALAVYFFHRGIVEKKSLLVVAAGLMGGLTSTVSPYSFTCLMLTLAAVVVGFAIRRWRSLRFWRGIGLLALFTVMSSAPSIYPMMANANGLEEALEFHANEQKHDLVSAFVNHENPLFGPPLNALLDTPADARISFTSYIGMVPLALVCIGLFSGSTRRAMLPWLILAAGFFVLRLGSTLSINGVAYPDILLPKYYLNEIFPSVFKSFNATKRFNIGFFLPFSLLAGYGVIALRAKMPQAARPLIILLLVGLIMVEYYTPIVDRVYNIKEFEYIDWLNRESADEIRLINVPMGRTNAKLYALHQAFNGFPHAAGSMSREPKSAYDYVRANSILNSWWTRAPLLCDVATRDLYLSALGRLESDGFSHVVFHQEARYRDLIADGLANAAPSYRDDYVWIYRLEGLRESCPA
ncbi:MAG: hypothetical protein OXG23_02395 [Chloroflexi bacterium]|nr:hypothetical protein [Chloroflexota bacterium]